MSAPNTNFVSSNYSTDLVNVFPVTSFYYVSISGTAGGSSSSGTVTLTTNYGTANYAVFSSIYYGFSGSSGTFDALATSNTCHPMVINTITSTSFEYIFGHGSGDNLNIYVVFMVVFNPVLDYTKSY
jgi:hypothetical protein